MSTIQRAKFLAIIPLLLVTTACVTEEVDELDEQSSIEQTDQAFWEASCFTAPVDASPGWGACTGTAPSPSFMNAAATSPNASYGSATCTNGFIVQSPFGLGITVAESAIPEVVTQADCTNTHIVMRTYLQNFAGTFEISSVSRSGTWVNSSTGSFCTVGSAPTGVWGQPASRAIPAGMYSGGLWYGTLSVRTVAVAYTGSTYRRVATRFRKPC